MRLRSEAISAHLRSSIRTIAEFHANLYGPQTRCRRTLAPTLGYCNTVAILTPSYVLLEYPHVLRLVRSLLNAVVVLPGVYKQGEDHSGPSEGHSHESPEAPKQIGSQVAAQSE